MITPLGWTTDDQITGRITPVIRWTTDDHITGMITVNTNSPRSCRRSWQPPGLLGNTAAAAATDPAGSKTGGRHPCPGSPAACGEHVAAQHDALKLAKRAPGIPRARTRVRPMRTADWRVRIRWICCCDCCCLINRLRAGAGADAWRCRGGMERQRASRHRGTGRRGTVRPPDTCGMTPDMTHVAYQQHQYQQHPT